MSAGTAPQASGADSAPRGPRIVFVTQAVDASDPLLAFVVGWIKALAARCERVEVIANKVGEVSPDLGAPVISLGKERARGRLARGFGYQVALRRTFARMRPDALLAHMCPVYLNLAVPLARAYGSRLVLWYAHPRRGLGLRMAERLADVVLTSLPGAYPGPSAKVRPIGQGIDVRVFSQAALPPRPGPLRLLALGRTSPSKGYPVAIEGIRRARARGVDVVLRIVGPATTPLEVRHRRELEGLISKLRLAPHVTLDGPLPHAGVPQALRECDALLNTTVTGSGDKAVLEAMASGRPVVVSNPAFAALVAGLPVRLQLLQGDPADLAACIADLAASPVGLRNEVGRRLRERVEREHSVDHWADSVAGLISDWSASRPRFG